MLHLADNLNRLGTETAFEVLARAADLAAKGKDIINLASANLISKPRRTSSRRRSKRCATGIMAIPRPTAFCRCARR